MLLSFLISPPFIPQAPGSRSQPSLPQICSSLASKFGGHRFVLLMDLSAASDTAGFCLVWHSFFLLGYGFYSFSWFFHRFLSAFAPCTPISAQCADSLLGVLPPPHPYHGPVEDSQVCNYRPGPRSNSLWAASTHIPYGYPRLTVARMRSCLTSGKTTENTFAVRAQACSLKMPPRHSPERVALGHSISLSWLRLIWLGVRGEPKMTCVDDLSPDPDLSQVVPGSAAVRSPAVGATISATATQSGVRALWT